MTEYFNTFSLYDIVINTRNGSIKGGESVNKWFYALYGILIAALSIVTGEIVTFIMLGLILVSLTNINITLKRILNKDKT